MDIDQTNSNYDPTEDIEHIRYLIGDKTELTTDQLAEVVIKLIHILELLGIVIIDGTDRPV